MDEDVKNLLSPMTTVFQSFAGVPSSSLKAGFEGFESRVRLAELPLERDTCRCEHAQRLAAVGGTCELRPKRYTLCTMEMPARDAVVGGDSGTVSSTLVSSS